MGRLAYWILTACVAGWFESSRAGAEETGLNEVGWGNPSCDVQTAAGCRTVFLGWLRRGEWEQACAWRVASLIYEEFEVAERGGSSGARTESADDRAVLDWGRADEAGRLRALAKALRWCEGREPRQLIQSGSQTDWGARRIWADTLGLWRFRAAEAAGNGSEAVHPFAAHAAVFRAVAARHQGRDLAARVLAVAAMIDGRTGTVSDRFAAIAMAGRLARGLEPDEPRYAIYGSYDLTRRRDHHRRASGLEAVVGSRSWVRNASGPREKSFGMVSEAAAHGPMQIERD